MFNPDRSDNIVLSAFAPELMKFYSMQFLKAEEGFEFTFSSTMLKTHKNWLAKEQDESYSDQEEQDAEENSNLEGQSDSRLREAKCRGWFCFEQKVEGLSLISIRFIELEKFASEQELGESVSRVIQETDLYRDTESETETEQPLQTDIESPSASKAIISSTESPRRVRLLKELIAGWLLAMVSLVVVQTVMKQRQYSQLDESTVHLSRLITRNDLIIKCASLLRRYEMKGRYVSMTQWVAFHYVWSQTGVRGVSDEVDID